jgi:UDP-2-acetamido-2,6-beta-L-arabino-hexul-4-ose reductase
MMSDMKVLVTGADGFFGKNIIVHLNEIGMNIITYTRKNSVQDLPDLIKKSDFIIHLAGENRPVDDKDFDIVNAGLTESICDFLRTIGRKMPVILASSEQVNLNNAYGRSKLKAEIIVQKFAADTGSSVYIYRLPRLFGKWCKPNYNSVVATFCHNISHNLPIQIEVPSFELNLVYIDDVIEEFTNVLRGDLGYKKVLSVQPEYRITVGDLADQIKLFKKNCYPLVKENINDEFVRKLYATYVSYIFPNNNESINHKVLK